MRVTRTDDAAYRAAYLFLEANESAHVAHDAMLMMAHGIEVAASFGSGGLRRAIGRKMFGGETLWTGTYTAQVHDAWVAVAPARPGDVTHVCLQPGDAVNIEQGAFLACSDDVTLSARWAGVRNIAMREGATVLQARGQGELVFCTYGALLNLPRLEDRQSMIVDTGHLVAWDHTVDIEVGALGSAAAAAASGEGLVARVTGPGRVWVQTRKEQQVGSWLSPERRQND